MLNIPITYLDDLLQNSSLLNNSLQKQAMLLSKQWGLNYILPSDGIDQYHFILQLTTEGLQLIDTTQPKVNPLMIDFSSGTYNHRRLFGGGKKQLIAKAVGLNKGFTPYVLDATAGIGRDAFVLASLGCQITLLERSPILSALLTDALLRAKENQEISPIINKMQLVSIDGYDYLSKNSVKKPDIIYLDPMYPGKKGTALVKKEMKFLHDVVGKDEDANKLLTSAINLATYRVVVKRPKSAGFLDNKKPSLQLNTKKQRYDIYIRQKLPISK